MVFNLSITNYQLRICWSQGGELLAIDKLFSISNKQDFRKNNCQLVIVQFVIVFINAIALGDKRGR